MLRPIIDVPLLEQKWLLYKGNEYMFKMLNNCRLRNYDQYNKNLECDNSKEPKLKKCFHGVLQKRESRRQERIFQKKLDDTKMSKSPIGPFILCKKFIPHALSNKASYKAMEDKEIYVENNNFKKRLTASRSFFEKVKCYNSVYQSQLETMKKSSSSKMMMKNKELSVSPQSYTSSDHMYHSPHMITKSKTFLTIKGRNPITPIGKQESIYNITTQSLWFDYKVMNDEMIKNNIQKVLIYKKRRYIQDFGLTNIKIIYKINQLNIVIEPLTTFVSNVFIIIIPTEKDLMILVKKFDSFDKVIRTIRFEEDYLMIHKEIKNFYYIAQVLNHHEYRASTLEKNVIDYT